MKKSRKIRWIILSILIICVATILLLPGSKLFVGSKLTVTMSAEVDGVDVVPYNITCTNGVGEEEKLRVLNKNNEVVIYVGASKRDKYIISYDVDTSDGVKHFSYGIMRTHQGGPRDSYWYKLDLNKDEETYEWEARIWLDRKNAETKAHTILLSEDENAYVQFGP